ncbi:MAG: dihydrofolate reductase [Crocinitomicaceae bacterium]
MKVSLIVAMDAKRGIGKNNDLMWHLPADMNFFKETTKNQIVVMGRRNYDSIPEKYRPLPNRLNVILTRNKEFQAENCLVFNSLKDCLTHFENENERKVFIIGGGEIYKMALDVNCLDEMFITDVDGVFDADTFFPEFDEIEWKVEVLSEQKIDEKHSHGFIIKKYTRK